MQKRFKTQNSLKVRVIPCLDIKDGKVVKGVEFENLRDAGDPVQQSLKYQEQMADELCFLDISATEENRSTLLNLVEKIAAECFLPFSVGGGIKTVKDAENLLLCGADKVVVNSAAISNPNLINQISQKLGSQSVLVAIDVKKNSRQNFFEVFTHGGKKPTGIDAVLWAEKVSRFGAGEILLTSMDYDGTKKGYNLELIKKVREITNLPIIASGGAGQLSHFVDAVNSGADAVLAASIFHFNETSILEAKKYMREYDIPVRIDD